MKLWMIATYFPFMIRISLDASSANCLEFYNKTNVIPLWMSEIDRNEWINRHTCKLCPALLPTTTAELTPAVVVEGRNAYAWRSPVTHTTWKQEPIAISEHPRPIMSSNTAERTDRRGKEGLSWQGNKWRAQPTWHKKLAVLTLSVLDYCASARRIGHSEGGDALTIAHPLASIAGCCSQLDGAARKDYTVPEEPFFCLVFVQKLGRKFWCIQRKRERVKG